MRNFVFLLVIIKFFINLTVLSAGEYSSTTGAEILNFDKGARQTGSGNSFVAVADDVQTLFYNPGGLGQLQKINLSLSHISLFSELSLQSVVFNYPLWKGSLGAGLNYLHSGEFNEIENGRTTSKKIYFSNFLFSAGYGIKINRMIYPGIGVKFLSSDIGGYKASTIAVDAGVVVGLEMGKFYNKIENNLKFGLCIQNIGTKMKYIQKKESLPEKVRLGVFYKPLSFVGASIEADYWFNYSLKDGFLFKAGVEFLPDYFITPRLGLGFDSDNIEFTFGISVGSLYRHYKYSFDIGYKGNKDLGSNLFLALNLGELPFYQYKKRMIIDISDFPQIIKAPESQFYTGVSSFIVDLKLNVKIQFPDISDNELKKMCKETVQTLEEEIKKSNLFNSVRNNEDIVVSIKLNKKNNKFLLILKLKDKEKKEIKQYKITFANKNVISKISKKIIEKMEKNIWKLFYCYFSLDSVPSGADVYINTQKAGKTPLAIDKLKTGHYKIVLRKKNYKDFQKTLKIESGKENTFSFPLNPLKYSLSLSVFNVLLKGKIVSPQLDDFNSAFQSLFKENIQELKDYMIMDELMPVNIIVNYSLVKKLETYSFKFSIIDKKENKSIKELNYKLKNDNKLPEAVDKVLNEIIEYIVLSKEKYKEYGFVKIFSIHKDVFFNFNKKNVAVPFFSRIETGEYKLRVYEDDEIISEKWIQVDSEKTNYINFLLRYKTDFTTSINYLFWDKDIEINTKGSAQIYVENSNLLIKSSEKKKYIRGALISKEFNVFPFQMQIKLKAKKIKNSKFYFGISDNKKCHYYILFDQKGYGALIFKNNEEETSTDLITSFKDEEISSHILKIDYDGFNLAYFVDDLLLKKIPATLGEKLRISMTGTSTSGMLFKIEKFEIKKGDRLLF